MESAIGVDMEIAVTLDCALLHPRLDNEKT